MFLLCTTKMSILHTASAKGDEKACRAILYNSRDPLRLCLIVDERGNTPLHLAAFKVHPAIVYLLLSVIEGDRACLLSNNCGETPLHLAVMKDDDKNREVLLMLLSTECGRLATHFMNPHLGDTPLELAIVSEARGCATILRRLSTAEIPKEDTCISVRVRRVSRSSNRS